MSRRLSTLLLSLAAVLVVIFSVNLWAWTTIIQTDAFVDRTSSVLADEASRDALASRIVDRLLEDRPLILATFGDAVKGAVSGILDSDRFQNLFSAIAGAVHRVLVAGGIDDVTVDVSNIRDVVNAVAAVFDREGARGADQPNEIVLFEGRDFPAVERTADTIPWICTISGLLAAGLIAAVVVWTRDRRSALRRLGLILAGASILSILLVIPARSVTISNFPLEDQQTIIATLFDSFVRRFVLQFALIAVVGCGLFVWASNWFATETVETSASPTPDVNPALSSASG